MFYFYQNCDNSPPPSLTKYFTSLCLSEIKVRNDINKLEKGIVIIYQDHYDFFPIQKLTDKVKIIQLIDSPNRYSLIDYARQGVDLPIHIYDKYDIFNEYLYLIIAENKDQFPDIKVGPLRLNINRKQIFLAGNLLDLRKKEYELLKYLVINYNKVVDKTEILEQVWKYRYDVVTKTVDTHFHYLKKKVNNTTRYGKILHNVYGEGYKLAV